MLPKIDVPTYDVALISGEVVKFRPFTVKEQKILLMALESAELDSTVSAIKQVVTNCLVEPRNMDDIPMIDLEFLFLNIRAKSVGENLDLYYTCNNQIAQADGSTKTCGMVFDVAANILEIEPLKPQANTIHIDEKISVIMKYPTFQLMNLLKRAESRLDAEIIVIGGCLDKIINGAQLVDCSKATPEEIFEFVESLTEPHYQKLAEWVRNAPQIAKTIEKNCPKCGHQHKLRLEGLGDFFT